MGDPATGKRIATGLGLGAVAVGLFAAGEAALTAFVGVLAILGSAELFRLQRARGMRPIPIVGFLGVTALIAVAYVRGEAAPRSFPPVVGASLALAFVTAMLRRRVEGVLPSIMSSLFGVVYVGVLSAYLVVLVRMPMGVRLALGFALMVVLNDVGSYAVGSWFGRRKLAPSVSPTKTWEGLAGGAVATLVVAVVVGVVLSPPFDRARALILGVIVLVTAPLGDLCESMLKRDLVTKNSGTLLPGHGGVLDRIDSLIFSAPLFFYAYRVLIR